MKVNARYWLNIFDLDHEESSQRELQNAIDMPLSMFFFDVEKTNPTQENEINEIDSNEIFDLKEAFTGDYDDHEKFGRAVLFPFNRNKIMARFENIADKFDMYAPSLKVDMEKFAEIFWMSSNPDKKMDMKFKITEHDLTVNMYEKEVEWMRKKVHWKGTDDEEIANRLSNDPEMREVYERDHLADSLKEITLVPQDIRTFVIYYYKPKSEADFTESKAEFMQS